MKSLTQAAQELYESVDIAGYDLYSNQDIENSTKILNHWNISANSGRARLKQIPGSLEIPEGFVESNIEGIKELIKIRKFCESCQVESPEKCPYDSKQIQQARKWEREEGVSEGSIAVTTLRSQETQRKDGDTRWVKYVCYRPGLIYQHDRLYISYTTCPVKSSEYSV